MIFLEFTVEGPPISHQSSNKAKLQAWREMVRAAAAEKWGGAEALCVPLRITVAYYHDGATARIDNDNMLKPIQDALNGLVYEDDKFITDVEVRKTNINEPVCARGAPLVLLEAFSRGAAFLHVTVGPAPDHTLPLKG